MDKVQLDLPVTIPQQPLPVDLAWPEASASRDLKYSQGTTSSDASSRLFMTASVGFLAFVKLLDEAQPQWAFCCT